MVDQDQFIAAFNAWKDATTDYWREIERVMAGGANDEEAEKATIARMKSTQNAFLAMGGINGPQGR